MLKSVELLGGWRPMCFNCSGQISALEPMPRTILGLKDALSRERRKRDRRIGKSDSRVFQYERRVGERRTVARDGYSTIEDDMIIEITIEATPDAGGGEDFDELTQIRELIRELHPVRAAAG
jgi:hypothetical protein|nr:hypothetical protein [Kofleriaceae bacterium]